MSSSSRIVAIALLSLAVSCRNDPPTQEDGGATGGGSGGGGVVVQPKCATDADCDVALANAAASPAGCASARCVVATGSCEFFTRDDDGDGERAANCSGSVAISTGTDCDDRPSLGSAINPAASEVCDEAMVDENCNGMANEGCSCPVVGAETACCSSRGTQTCEAIDGGGAALSVCSAPVAAEQCNGFDDDCNGVVDDSAGFAVDGGSVTIDGGIAFADGGCSVGIGACARTGNATCVSASIGCNAEPGAPGVESCNGLDDDCDGQIDENPNTLCSITGQSCRNGSCSCGTADAGQPMVVCGTSCVVLGGSCSVGVGACARTGAQSCIGGAVACNATPGTPSTEICDNIDNNCNGQIDEGSAAKVVCYPDDDGDGYWSSQTVNMLCQAPGRAQFGGCPVGFVAPSSSGINPDCANGNPNAFVNNGFRDDVDGDGHCTGATVTLCEDFIPPAGKRFVGMCAVGDDCNDNNNTLYQNLSVRPDADGDGYCGSGLFPLCSGASPPAGYRLASGCQGINDCKDTNPWATTTCSITDGYLTSSASKSCGIGPPPCETLAVNVDQGCPTGFHPENFVTGLNAPSTCSVVNPTTVNSCCGGIVFGTASCRIRATCVAD